MSLVLAAACGAAPERASEGSTGARDTRSGDSTGRTLGDSLADSLTGVIGRDSAFGPMFSVDSAGNLVPLRPPK